MVEKHDNPAFLKYLDGLVEQLRELSGRAVKGNDPEAVHDARVATRRLKAALDLLKPVISRRQRAPLAKIGRLLRRRLGELRDLDVMIEHLTMVTSTRLEPAAQWMIQRLEKRREKASAKAAADLPTPKVLAKLGSWWGLREEIAAASEALDSLLAGSIHLQLDAFAEDAAKLLEPSASHDPHQLRIDGKALRYTLELAKAHGQRLPRPVLANFRRIQTALGLWHDFVVLSERVLSESCDAHLAFHDPAGQKAMLSLAAISLRRGQQRLAKVSELWRTNGKELIEQIRQTFPLTAPPKEPDTSVAPLPEPETSPNIQS